MPKIGTRVMAIESAQQGELRVFGEGIYMGKEIPNLTSFIAVGLENPCILLDNGKYIWGFQCWWGSSEAVKKRYEGVKTVEVPIENHILPYSEVNK